jgi:hypothetical protein
LKMIKRRTAINPLKTTWFYLIVSWIWIYNKCYKYFDYYLYQFWFNDNEIIRE